MKRFCATSTEALFVSGGYMPLGKGDAVVIKKANAPSSDGER